MADKKPWTDCITCRRQNNCDWCPFVRNRVATPLGANHIWRLHKELNKDGSINRPGLLDEFLAPTSNLCPFGVQFKAAVAKRELLLIHNVDRGVVSPASAILNAERMGMDLEGENSELAREN